MDGLQIKFPMIRPITPYMYQIDKCQHGKSCTFSTSFFNGDLVQVSCNWCAEELGYPNPTIIHSDLCRDYNCMCTPRYKNTFTFLYNALNGILPEDVIHYLVPFYIDLYKCGSQNAERDTQNVERGSTSFDTQNVERGSTCRGPSVHNKPCIHCKTNVCGNCVSVYCDCCNDTILCNSCKNVDYNYFPMLKHGYITFSNEYNACKMCCKYMKKCGWCTQYIFPDETFCGIHTCKRKYEIVNKREYYWLQQYTRFDTLFHEACEWYFTNNRQYQPELLYEAIRLEAIQDFIEQGGGCVFDVPKSMRLLLRGDICHSI